MKKEKVKNGYKLVARKGIKDESFDIYIHYLGIEYYLMSHRNNETLYSLISKGMTTYEIKQSEQKLISGASLAGKRFCKGATYPRLKAKKNWSRKLENSINHIMTVAEDFILYELDYDKTAQTA